MNKSSKNLFQEIGKGFWLLTAAFLFFPSPAACYHILFYYNGSGENGSVYRCATILRKAGHRVTVLNAAGKAVDPTNDNWGAPYDQVWDMRFVNRDKEECGSGSRRAADYFDSRWRSKAVSFLNHCGKLFIAGEHYPLADRDEGLYDFLQQIQAVREGFDNCPPSRQGNSTTNGEAFYPVRNGLGPVSFFGRFVGGIPIGLLTGTNFVSTDEDWQGGSVDRSIAAGWKGNQIGGDVNAPTCARGKLFMVWDATMWTLWDRDVQENAQRAFPVWEESSWFSWDPDAEEDRGLSLQLQKAQSTTKKFFPAIAKWLGGGRDCPCAGPAVPTAPRWTPIPQPTRTFKPGPVPTVSGKPALAAHPSPTRGILAASAPETIVFTVPPVNIYMSFRDGPGIYLLEIYDGLGNPVRAVFEKNITTQKESWTSWDGVDNFGKLMGEGTYFAVLSKDGRVLRKIVLRWLKPQAVR